MAGILWAMGLSLLIQGCLSSVGQTDRGCMQWEASGTNVCCTGCHPGHRIFRRCGPNPKDLCVLCETGTYNTDPTSLSCKRCTQCVGAQVLSKNCTATTDTECDCIEGYTCGNKACSFCVKTCGKGEEPTEMRTCRPCPHGTFNDQSHQKCKPWSSKCPNPNHVIVANGDALNDIKCRNASANTEPNQPAVSAVATAPVANPTEDDWPLALVMVPFIVLTTFIIFIIMVITVTLKRHERKTPEKEPIKPPIIRTPTDEPCTLVAIECSFHEAQQEQGSSSESLASKDSSDPLIA